jgi:hypothetical protein
LAPPPPPSSPHSTVTPPPPLTLRGRDLCGLPRLSRISPSCCPLGSLLDPALLSAAQQSSPHSLPLPSPPPPAAPSLTLALYSPTLTSCTPCGLRPPTSLPLSPSPQSAVASPLAVPLPPSLRRPPHERRQGRPSGLSRRARRRRKAVRACVSSVAGLRSKERGDEGLR